MNSKNSREISTRIRFCKNGKSQKIFSCIQCNFSVIKFYCLIFFKQDLNSVVQCSIDE